MLGLIISVLTLAALAVVAWSKRRLKWAEGNR
jgi:hypothetical protein